MAGLSTHILDTHAGIPAQGVKIELFAIAPDGSTVSQGSFTTNADGRTDGLLIAPEVIRPGTFELRFHMGAYFKGRGVTMSEPPFLDVIPLRFGIADPAKHYHVPLLASPWSYSTYRGS